MSKIYKIELNAKDLPSDEFDGSLTIDFSRPVDPIVANKIVNSARAVELSHGDTIFLKYNGEKYKLGQKYKDYPAIIKEIYYAPRPWWKFWKKKDILGYLIMFVGGK